MALPYKYLQQKNQKLNLTQPQEGIEGQKK